MSGKLVGVEPGGMTLVRDGGYNCGRVVLPKCPVRPCRQSFGLKIELPGMRGPQVLGRGAVGRFCQGCKALACFWPAPRGCEASTYYPLGPLQAWQGGRWGPRLLKRETLASTAFPNATSADEWMQLEEQP